MITAHRPTRRLAAVLIACSSLAVAWGASGALAGVAWHESYASAQSASKASQRPVLLVFTASWCEACQHLDSRLWANQEAAALVTACYEPVLVDVDTDPALARRMGISHIPSACVLDGNDHLLNTFDVPPTAATFVAQAARALHESSSTTVAPTTNIDSRFPTEASPQATAQAAGAPPATMPPPTSTPAASVADDGRYAASGSRYTQRPVSAFESSGSAAAAAPQQLQRASIDPPPQASPASQEAPPWLANQPPASQPRASLQSSAPATFAPAQPPLNQPQQPQQGYASYPAAPPFDPQAGLASAAPAQTRTPYPTPPPEVDSAATATDRAAAEEEEGKSKNSFLATLQKPFAFMMPKESSDNDLQSTANAGNAPTPYPVGLDGYCPVSLAEQATWTEGRAQWGVQHRGRTYLFASATEQQRFLANPDRYAPALSGDDVVLAFEAGNQIPGQRRYGVTYQGRIYLFSSLETRSRFAANPQAYASRVRLAESPGAAAGGTMLR